MAAGTAAVPRTEAAVGAGRVLVADDDPAMAGLLAAALGKRGYRVETVGDGDAAEHTAATGGFDLVLLDMVLPAADGMDILRRLRERFDEASLPVVMLTSVGDRAAVVAALEAGANDYVTKPFDLAVVLARVRTQVTLRRQAAALRDSADRLRRDFAAAARAQRAALPPRAPRFGPFRFGRRFEPCELLSGDGLNVFPVGDRHVAFYVLDACGHGARAALLAAAAGRLLLPAGGEADLVCESLPLLDREVTRLLRPDVSPIPPSEVAARLARRFRDDPSGEFFTLVYALLDIGSGDVTYACAGHPAPVHVPAVGLPRRLPSGGLMIGADAEGAGYEDRTVRLRPGDRLLLHTDGLTETRSTDGELFGDGRLLAALSEAPPGVEPLLDAALDAASGWSGAVGPCDDRTLLALEREAV